MLDLGIRPEISLGEWRLEIGGLVENPQTFTWEQFNALPQFEDVSDFHCVTTWSKFDCRWQGVAFFTLVDLVRPKPEVQHVLFTSYDGYSTNVRLSDCLDDDVLIATQFDGKPITREHGGPARVIIPKLYAWKGAKFVKTIEFAAEDKPRLLGGARLQQHRGSLDGRPLLVSEPTPAPRKAYAHRRFRRALYHLGFDLSRNPLCDRIDSAAAHGGRPVFSRRRDHVCDRSLAGRAEIFVRGMARCAHRRGVPAFLR